MLWIHALLRTSELFAASIPAPPYAREFCPVLRLLLGPASFAIAAAVSWRAEVLMHAFQAFHSFDCIHPDWWSSLKRFGALNRSNLSLTEQVCLTLGMLWECSELTMNYFVKGDICNDHSAQKPSLKGSFWSISSIKFSLISLLLSSLSRLSTESLLYFLVPNSLQPLCGSGT